MATIGWIKAGVAVDTTQFARGLDRASGLLGGFHASLMGIGASLGVAFGARELVGWVRGAAEAVTETQTLGERVGMTSEAFGKLQYAAKLSHVDGETLTHSLEKMNEKLGDVATTGEGPTADALRRFGLSARQLAMMGTEQAFFKLADVIGSIRNPAERASVAIDLFGKSGQGVINMASKGSDALRAMGEEGLKTGAVLSAIDSARVAEANVAMVRLDSAIQGIAGQIAVELAPFVTAAADQFVAWMQTGTRAGSHVAQAIDFVTDAVGVGADAVQVWQASFFTLQSVVLTVLSKISQGIAVVLKDMDSIAHSGWTKAIAPELGLAWNLLGTGEKKALTQSADFFRDWSADLAAEAGKSGEAAAAAWGKPWAHEHVREFVDDMKFKADQRATFNAQKQAGFANPGALEHPKIVDLNFAGANEVGSKEAYSAILKSRSMQMSAIQNRIEVNTRVTAEATQRTATATTRLANFFDQRKSGGDGELARQMMPGW